MDKQLFERIKKRIEGYKDEMVELQRKLVATPAIGPEAGGDGELEKSKILEPIIRGIFDEVEIYKAPDKRVSYGYRPNIVAKMKGKSDEKTIWIMAHMDVVPPGDEKKWETPPFKLTIKNGTLYGRGVEDNHLGIIGAIFTAKALKEEGVKPSYTVGSLFAAEEETGSEYGVRYLLENHAHIFRKHDLLIIPDWGNPEGSAIEVGEKSIVWLRVKTTGKQAHAAFPYNGINAYRAAAHLICKMEQLTKKYPQKDDLYDPPINTFEVTMKEKNIPNFNTIPGEDITCFDCRLLPLVNVNDFLKTVEGYFKEIENEFKVKISYEMPFRSDGPSSTPVDSPIVPLIKNAAKDVLNVDTKPLGSGGQTVGTWFRNKGLHVAVYSKAVGSFHQPNEHLPIELMLENTKIMAHIMTQ